MRIRIAILFLIILSGGLGFTRSTVLGAQDREPVDRILAVVDDDPILASEASQIVAFGIIKPEEGEAELATQRRALDFLIEERLRFHEVDRFGFAEVPIDVVDEEFARLEKSFGGPAKFAEALEDLGLDEQGARQVVARQIMIWVYVEERLGARIFVGLEDIRQYYDEELVPRLVEQGSEVPPIEEVREPIRTLLREQRKNEELERWTMELLQEADIEDYFESAFDSLPDRKISIDTGSS